MLGTVYRVARDGSLIVRARETVDIDSRVFDEQARLIGVVYDVIGPVKTPFVVVKVTAPGADPELLRGKTLYVEDGGGRRR